ncbi:MAG TPA: aminotransferase class I/II-fold pyridoxal phosphate-dependent enzyme [bacterium]|jgi:threonine-phosphate decarboxylase|nr:aminotransferase class I/II-fold pyridoxal phosphate-dependent enzyme [bacterium]
MTISFEHGGDLEKAARLAGSSPADILDFSNLLNPSGCPPGLEEALKAQLGSAFRHPSSGDALKTRLAKKLGVSPEQVFLGAGTTEFIHFLPLWRKPQRPVIVGPTYGDYAPALRRLGVEPKLLLAAEENGWVLSSQQWEACFRDKPDFMILSRPNNPLGQSVYRALLKDMIQSHPETFFVVDETCIEIADDPADHFILSSWPMNLAVLRSFSKTYAVPGLRLGYLVVSPNLTSQLAHFQMPWTVSPLAQSAGLFLAHQENWLAGTQKANRAEKDRVLAQLEALAPFRVIPSGMTAFTLKGLAPNFSSSKLLERLLVEEKILIRSLAQHEGLGDVFFRIGLRTPTENQKLVSALQKWDS